MMASDMEREVAASLKFSLAEASLLHEHLRAAEEGCEALRAAIATDNGQQVMDVWNSVSEHVTYVGTIFNLKGSTAARQYIEKRGEGS